MSNLLIHYSFGVHQGKIGRKMKEGKDGRRIFQEGKKKPPRWLSRGFGVRTWHLYPFRVPIYVFWIGKAMSGCMIADRFLRNIILSIC